MDALIPPHSLQSEEATLGSLLIDGEAIERVAGILQPEQFYTVKNQWIYSCMIALHNRHEPIDFLTVCQELDKSGKLEEVGGERYISELTAAVPTALNVETYAKGISSLASRRKLLNTASDIARAAYDQEQPLDKVIAESEAQIFSVSKGQTAGKFLKLNTLLGRVWDKVEDAFNYPDKPRGIPYGFAVLDAEFGNAEYDALITIGARPGMGKSALMLSMAIREAKEGYAVLFYPYEMSAEQLTLRVVSQETGYSYKEIEYAERHIGQTKRPMNGEELDAIAKAISSLENLPLYFREDMPTIEGLKSSIVRAQSEFKLDTKRTVVHVDYIQIIPTVHRFENTVAKVTHITGTLKQIARALHLPIIAASQLSRDVEKRQDNRPTLSDLRDSGSVEQDSDVVMFIYRDEVYKPESDQKGIAEILVRKNRNGKDGVARLHWDGHRIAFNSLVTERVELWANG